MTLVITPTPEYDDVLTAPEDGDDLDAALIAGDLQVLANRAEATLLHGGLLHWSHSARVPTSGGTNNGNTAVYVGPIQSIALLSGSAWVLFRDVAELQLTCAANFGGGTLANDTNYYVYGYVAAGLLTYEISTTVPDAFLRWKSTGAQTHRYLFYFHTGSAGVAVPMTMRRGLYQFRINGAGGTVFAALIGGVASGGADVLLARSNTAGRNFFPPHMRLVHVRPEVVYSGGTAGDIATLTLIPKADTTNVTTVIELQGVAAAINRQRDLWMEVATDMLVTYSLVTSDTAILNLYVLGCQE